MGVETKIAVRRGTGEPELVPLWTMAEGLAVVEPQPGRFTVTHVRSGLALWPAFPSEQPRTFDTALRAWAVALESGIDWTQDADVIKAEHATVWPTIRNRMRRAAFPPRRPRWHAGDHRRRVRPWVAAHRAEALREAIRCDLRSCLGDFFDRTRWREEFYGTALIRPQRQGCTRFVARRAARLGVVRRMARRAHRVIAHNARHHTTAEDRVQGYGAITWDAAGRVAALRPHEWVREVPQ